MDRPSLTALRIVLVLAGAFTLFTGINLAFGGMLTLGWQGANAFLAVTDEHAFLVQDSHIRFFGGLWMGVGTLLMAATANLPKYRGPLNLAFALIFLGGLARMSQMHLEVTFGPDILGSLLAELAGMPLLYLWLSRAVRQPA